MSNQVYSAPRQKYYTRGLNFYNMAAPEIILASTSSNIHWIESNTIQRTDMVELDVDGNFTLSEEGMFSISASVGLSPVSELVNPYYRVAIQCAGIGYTTQLIKNENLSQNTLSGSSITPIVPVSWSGWLGAGTVFSITISNLDAVNQLVVLDTESRLIISKIY